MMEVIVGQPRLNGSLVAHPIPLTLHRVDSVPLARRAVGRDRFVRRRRRPPWPQTVTQDGNTMRIYPPQLDTWANRLDFTGRVAAVVTPAAAPPRPASCTSRRGRAPTRRIASSRCPTSGHRRAVPHRRTGRRDESERARESAHAEGGDLLSLDYLLARWSRRQTATSRRSAPRRRRSSRRAARPVVQFEGTPTFVTVAGTNVQYAINTNWPVLRTVNAPTLYLLDSTGWLTSETLTTGVWGTRRNLPTSRSCRIRRTGRTSGRILPGAEGRRRC
jgi:hypothetical protein